MAERVIAVVEHDGAERERLGAVLTEAGYAVLPCAAGALALGMIRAAQPALVLLNLDLLPPPDGWACWEQLRAKVATVRIPVITYARDVEATAAQAAGRRLRAPLLAAPLAADALLAAVAALLGPAPGAAPAPREKDHADPGA